MPYADPEKRKQVSRESARKAYWQNPSKARASRRTIPGTCEVCGIEYLGRLGARCCSRSCAAKLAHSEGRMNNIGGTGPTHPKWRGGRKLNLNGYVMVFQARKKLGKIGKVTRSVET